MNNSNYRFDPHSLYALKTCDYYYKTVELTKTKLYANLSSDLSCTSSMMI